MTNYEQAQATLESSLEILRPLNEPPVLVALNHPASFQKTRNRPSQLSAQLEVQLTHQEIELVQQCAGAKIFPSVVEDILRYYQ